GFTPYHEHAFLWENGVTTDLGMLAGVTSRASAINDAGQIVGQFLPEWYGTYHTFLWMDGAMTDLGESGAANDINQSGQIAGAGNYYYAFATLWTPTAPNGTTGSFESLGTLPPDRWEMVLGEDSSAIGVNDFGNIVGYAHTMYSYPNPEDGYFDIYRGFIWA